MAIYATFFLADPRQLAKGFPGWKRRLPKPVRSGFRNPFTKQLVIVEKCEPEWPEDSPSAAFPEFRSVVVDGNYASFLERRLPPVVSKAEHWAAKGLTDIEIEPLLRAVGVATELESPLFAPPSSGAVLREFPFEFISKLTASDQNEVASHWAAEMSTPRYTHSATGSRLNEGWTFHQATQILAPIALLAAKASPEQKLYLLIEM